MLYTRSPLKEKYNQYKDPKTLFQHKKQKDFTTSYNREHSFKKTYLDKGYNDKNNVSQFLLGPNCIYTKSEMIYEPENQYEQKYEQQYTKTIRNQNKTNKPKITINDERKFNAKQAEIQSKINKIQNYQNKIQSLLDFVRSSTPNKKVQKSTSYAPSKSVSKLTTPLSHKQNNNRQNLRNFDKINIIEDKQLSYSNTGYKKTQDRGRQESVYRLNRYFKNQNKNFQQIQQKRQKSRQFMKNIQGEVKEIKHTVEQLNEKIKKVDYPFKKQIVLDLSSSNPQTIKQTNELNEYPRLKTQNKQPKQLHRNHHDFQSPVKQNPISKYEQYKMMRKKQAQQQKYSPQLGGYKKTGYIYNYKA